MKEIELLIKKSTLRDVTIKLLDKKLEGMIIPDIIFDILQDLENGYESNKTKL